MKCSICNRELKPNEFQWLEDVLVCEECYAHELDNARWDKDVN